jgi:hypothetical protein
MASQSYTDPDVGKAPEQLFAERSKRVQDAMELKQPDRIPIQLGMSYFLADMYGVTHQEQQENGEVEMELLEKAAKHFQPDVIFGVFNNPGASLALGDRMTRFPGHDGMGPEGSYQFVEGEYMKGEDYDAFIEDPADWSIRKYWPRVFKECEGLAMLPPLGMAAFGAYCLGNMSFLRLPPVARALNALAKAADAQVAADARTIESSKRLAALGFAPPPLAGSVIEAPFDLLSDTLRGMKGIMLDLYRRPDKLLAAQEKVLNFELEYAVGFSRATGLKMCFIPLHRGSDGFMSLSQFEKFYWPQLKTLMVGLVDAGITPFVFYEGAWDQRLHYLADLPRGKTAGWFQSSDVFKVKEIVGDTMCIVGGMRNTLLQAGSADDVRVFTKQLCEKVGKGGGFIMSTTVGEMEGCKPDLVKAWVDATKEFGVYA